MSTPSLPLFLLEKCLIQYFGVADQCKFKDPHNPQSMSGLRWR
jgi:hypothetical protein